MAPLALNVALDMATDQLDQGKRTLCGAAARLGRRRILFLATGEMVAACLLAIAIGIGWGRWWPGVWALVILVTQLTYNLEPVRPVAPTFLLSYTATGTPLDPPACVVVTGMRTPAVRHGPTRALHIACHIVTLGVVLLAAGLWWRYDLAWAAIGAAVPLAVLAIMARSAVHQVAPGHLKTANHTLARTIPLITFGELVIAALPLAAGTL